MSPHTTTPSSVHVARPGLRVVTAARVAVAFAAVVAFFAAALVGTTASAQQPSVPAVGTTSPIDPPAAAATTVTPRPGRPAPTDTSHGAVLYHNYCSVCHGDKGDGRSRAAGALSTMPRDFTTDASKRELSRERIRLAIEHGRPGTAMVGWKTQLSAVDMDRVADYVLTRFIQRDGAEAATTAAAPAHPPISGTRAHGGREADAASASAPVVDMTVGLPNGLKGDAKRGGAFYLANCATCHGAKGDGAGPRAYFINPKPRDFLAAPSRASLNRVALYAAISEGRLRSEMPAWDKVATPQQIADVAEHVLQTFIRPPTKP